jgi:hypothetical protein
LVHLAAIVFEFYAAMLCAGQVFLLLPLLLPLFLGIVLRYNTYASACIMTAHASTRLSNQLHSANSAAVLMHAPSMFQLLQHAE